MSQQSFNSMKNCLIAANSIGIFTAILVTAYGAVDAIHGSFDGRDSSLGGSSSVKSFDNDGKVTKYHRGSLEANVSSWSSSSESSTDSMMTNENDGIEIVFLAMFTLTVGFIGFWGAIREHFLLLLVFALTLFLSLFLRIIFLLNYYVEDTVLLWEQRVFGLFFACCELILGIFAIKVAFIIKSGIYRTRSTRVLHYIHRSREDLEAGIDGEQQRLAVPGQVDLSTSVRVHDNTSKKVSFDF